MVAQPSRPRDHQVLEPEERLLLGGISWAAYVAISDALGEDQPGTRVTYLDGELEIMVTSSSHELAKKLFARLFELWLLEADVALDGAGHTTFRKKAAKRGLEPDECYFFGRVSGTPDIAIEVVVANPLVDKLEVYRGLGVREVWVLHVPTGSLKVHRLVGAKYREHKSSALLPALDLALLTSFVRLDGSQHALVKAYRAELRRRAV